MKNRLSRMAKSASWMLVLLAACGVTSSCKDDYTLDDEKPGWLSSSIYQRLQDDGHYNYYLRLIGDADVNPISARPLTEVLSRTGSKTVFVANDDAWNAFFAKNATLPASNPWHGATGYDKLSVAQKKLIIHTSMLNNAIVMENLASSEGSDVTRGEYMRRYTDVEATDSITHLSGDELPINYNEGNGESDYWQRFRTDHGGKGLYLVTDSSLSMMIHFTAEHMSKNNITDDDFSRFMGRTRQTKDVHIYDALLLDQDEVCENGYVNVTEKVLTPLPSMAEVIRTNGKTNIFSHMLDRWSAPFYNAGVTEAYKKVMASRGVTWTDSIFTKRYFSDLSWGHTALSYDPQGQQFHDAQSTDVNLKFDPAWNAFYDEKTGPQYDMAAMFVPNDETLWKYFAESGGGWQLIQTYYLKQGTEEQIPYVKPATLEDLYKQIDQIPISTLRSLINIIMFKSFISSVPSKMTKLRDDAQEQIFYTKDLEHIVGHEMASNGVVYITDEVYGPADYTSVTAPAYISETNKVMRWAIYNGSTGTTDVMGLNYYAYLKAMQSKFVFFLPSDDAMQYYYDPVSFKSKKQRVLSFSYNSKNTFPIAYKVFRYDVNSGEIGAKLSNETMTQSEITNRLKDVLESHTIVLDTVALGGKSEINTDVDEYYVTKNGSGVKVIRGLNNDGATVIKQVQGGFQLENSIAQQDDPSMMTAAGTGVLYNNVTEEHDKKNGTTYVLDSPIIPSAKSVYNVFTNDGKFNSDEYEKFYSLCETNEEIVRACGLVDENSLSQSQQKTELKKYQIFVSDNGPDYNVQFFNNYRYTVFVPDSDAINAAISLGLPTWKSIEADFNNCKDTLTEHPKTYADSLRLQAEITYLINFVRYHFADNSVFVDHSTISPTEYVTASYDNKKGLFCKINIKRSDNQLQVQDVNGGDYLTVSGKYNVMARDLTCSKSPNNQSTMNGITIDGSSFAVIHQIHGVLNHTSLSSSARYDSQWATSSAAKAYLKRFAIH